MVCRLAPAKFLAACLKDHQRAIVVGERTWGKGTVQNIIRLEGGRSALKLTTASYWRPNGKNIHRGRDDKREKIPYESSDPRDWGVRPSDGFEVLLDEDQDRKRVERRRERDYTNGSPPAPTDDDAAEPFDDPQLRKAIDYLQQELRRVGRRIAGGLDSRGQFSLTNSNSTSNPLLVGMPEP